MKQANQKESSKSEKTRNRSRYDESDDSDGGFKRRATSLRRGRVITKGSDMQKFFSKSDNSEIQSTSNTRKLIRGWSCDRKVSNAERFEPSVPLPLPNETHRAKFEYINGTSQGYKHKLSAWNSARKPQVTFAEPTADKHGPSSLDSIQGPPPYHLALEHQQKKRRSLDLRNVKLERVNDNRRLSKYSCSSEKIFCDYSDISGKNNTQNYQHLRKNVSVGKVLESPYWDLQSGDIKQQNQQTTFHDEFEENYISYGSNESSDSSLGFYRRRGNFLYQTLPRLWNESLKERGKLKILQLF